MELNEVISVTKAKGFRHAIGVASKKGNIITVDYPLFRGGKEIYGGSIGFRTEEVTAIRPATEEEIKEWRNTPGIAKTARKTANTADKVMKIKWVAIGLLDGSKIINTL